MSKDWELWLDTNILRRWNLRLNTAEAEKFFKFSKEWNYEILLPEVVLSELVQHYVRQAERTLSVIPRSKGHLVSLEIDVSEKPWAHPPADLTAFYREVLTRRCAEKSINIVPVAEVPAPRLFDLSVRRIPPFEGEKGERGLHDALILFTILEHARQNQQTYATLISDDGIFQEENILALAEEYGVNLVIHESVDAFIAHINALVEKVDQALRRERETRVCSFLIGHRPDIERFIEQNAVFGEGLLSGGLVEGTIKNVIGISLENIEKVTVFPAPSEEEGTVLLFITFTARLKILLETEVSPWSQLWKRGPRRYRVGLEPEEQPVHGFGSPSRQTLPVIRDVVCEATAIDRFKEKTLSNLDLKEVKSETEGEILSSLLRGLSPPGTPE